MHNTGTQNEQYLIYRQDSRSRQQPQLNAG